VKLNPKFVVCRTRDKPNQNGNGGGGAGGNPSSTTAANVDAESGAAQPNGIIGTDLFGQYKGFSLSPIRHAPPATTSATHINNNFQNTSNQNIQNVELPPLPPVSEFIFPFLRFLN